MQTTSTVVYEGGRRMTMKFTGVSDGDNETRVKKVDVAAMTPRPTSVKIKACQYEVSGGILQMLWDADEPVVFENVAITGDHDYEMVGGLANGGGPTATGSILFSTMGMDSGSSYSVVLDLIKKY